ncbi:MAG: elongation factor P maturation arginine rhamnosyltransferase EarP [Rhodocyclaceae bacterium]
MRDGTWNIFCRVVDNFGDIGVCWRLARELRARFGLPVRLWVDHMAAFRRICPQAASALTDEAVWTNGGPALVVVEGVEVRRWPDGPGDAAGFAKVADAAVVIEAFACDLPEAALAAMAQASPPPLWINLEYLSAEDWVGDYHGLSSPHPRLPLVKRFFFPGFDARTGGLLRERELLAARDAFLADRPAALRFLACAGVSGVEADVRRVSLFAYETPALPDLLALWETAAQPTLLLVPEGRVLGDLGRHLGQSALRAGDRLVRGALDVAVLPFLSQHDYDRLLWCCDLNFVRGEDSFVRAQWAARPCVWQIYRQAEDAHQVKLDAFLARYGAQLEGGDGEALAAFWRAWNGRGDPAACWPAMDAALPRLARHARQWCEQLAEHTDLCTNLVEFSGTVLK